MDRLRWRRLPAQLRETMQQHTLTVVAAGVAFYAFLALVPTLIVIVSIFGLVADPGEIEIQVDELGRTLPDEASELVVDQLVDISRSSGSALTVTTLISTIIALWSASTGVVNLLRGISVASGTSDVRNLAVKRGIGVLFMLGAAVFLVLATVVVALLPSLLADTDLVDEVRLLIDALRFPALALVMLAVVGLLYHFAEPVPPGPPRLVSWGTVTATALWLLSSAAFSLYTANFGRYNEIYGSLGAVVVLLLWLWISALAVLVGAAVDAEIDRTDDDRASRP
jgi:membrane protein